MTCGGTNITNSGFMGDGRKQLAPVRHVINVLSLPASVSENFFLNPFLQRVSDGAYTDRTEGLVFMSTHIRTHTLPHTHRRQRKRETETWKHKNLTLSYLSNPFFISQKERRSFLFFHENIRVERKQKGECKDS